MIAPFEPIQRVKPPPTPRERQVYITTKLHDAGLILDFADRVLILDLREFGTGLGASGQSLQDVANADLVVHDRGDHLEVVKYRHGPTRQVRL